MNPTVSQILRRISFQKDSVASIESESVESRESSREPSGWSTANFILASRLCIPYLFARREPRPVRTDEERRAAQTLIYQEYLSRGYCAPNMLAQHFNIYSILPTCRMLVMTAGRDCFGTLSAILDSEVGLPMEKLYPEEVRSIRERGRRICEIGLLALDCSRYNQHSYSLTSIRKTLDLFSLIRTLYAQTRIALGQTDWLIVVHPKHENLYRYMGFEAIGPVRSYPGAEGNLALPMRLDLVKLAARADRNIVARFLTTGHSGAAELKKVHPYSYGELLLRLGEHPKLWRELSQKERAHLIQVYPRLSQWSDLLDSLNTFEPDARRDWELDLHA